MYHVSQFPGLDTLERIDALDFMSSRIVRELSGGVAVDLELRFFSIGINLWVTNIQDKLDVSVYSWELAWGLDPKLALDTPAVDEAASSSGRESFSVKISTASDLAIQTKLEETIEPVGSDPLRRVLLAAELEDLIQDVIVLALQLQENGEAEPDDQLFADLCQDLIDAKAQDVRQHWVELVTESLDAARDFPYFAKLH